MVNNKALSLLLAAAGSAIAGPVNQPAVSKRAVPTGQLIYGCTVPGVVALTFDDGPYEYTSQALDLLDAAGFKGTFFVNGANWGSIYDYADDIERAYASGHQIGSHTWSHADLGTLDAAGVTSQMTQVEDALVGMIGVYGTYMRAPYLSTSGVALSTLGSLGYHVIDISIDTKDYELQDNIPQALANFEAGLDAGGTISLEHDVHQFTIQTLLPELIDSLQSRGLQSVTVGQCLGDPQSNWYAPARNGGPATPTTTTGPSTPTGGSLPDSPDWSCGAAVGYRCPGSNCCSQWGWCGTGSEYCAAGCQAAYGTCS